MILDMTTTRTKTRQTSRNLHGWWANGQSFPLLFGTAYCLMWCSFCFTRTDIHTRKLTQKKKHRLRLLWFYCRSGFNPVFDVKRIKTQRKTDRESHFRPLFLYALYVPPSLQQNCRHRQIYTYFAIFRYFFSFCSPSNGTRQNQHDGAIELYAHNIREQQYNLLKFKMKIQIRNVIPL